MNNTTLGKQYIAQVQAQEIFKNCIAEHGDWLKDYMYMYTDNEGVNWFKNIVSRKYVGVKI